MRTERAKPDESKVSSQIESASTAAALQKTSTPTSPNQGAFATLMDARRANLDSEKKDKPRSETESDASVERDSETSDRKDADVKTVARDDDRESSGESSDGDSTGGFAFHAALAEPTSEASVTAPPARSILHVADLERIVSAVRADSFAAAKEVTIELKNSVLEGLRIHMKIAEGGELKVELLAFSDQVKKQIDARKAELESVLKDRSIKFDELKVKVALPEERQSNANSDDLRSNSI